MNALVVKTALLALVLLCTAQAQSTQTNVTEATRIKACGALNDAACRVVKPCTYCRSRWGESKCFAAEQVSTLPAGICTCRLFPCCRKHANKACLGTPWTCYLWQGCGSVQAAINYMDGTSSLDSLPYLL